MRIAAFSNLPMAEAVRLFERGEYLEQNLYGCRALQTAGHDMTFLEPGHRYARQATELSGFRLGDLDQQLQALRARADLVYCGAESASVALGLLRRRRLLRVPLVCVVHSPPLNARGRGAASGYDLVFTLSDFTRRTLIAQGRSPEATKTLSWGPQIDHPLYATRRDSAPDEPVVVSAGKSHRDVSTLRAALGVRDGRMHGDAPQGPHSESLDSMAQASVIAIPFLLQDRMIGLTELNDALALGKPIIMTRSPHTDVDIEAIGCGFWVEPGDVEGWRRALAILDDLELARQMGRRGLAYAEREWNAEVCGRQVVDGVNALGDVVRPD